MKYLKRVNDLASASSMSQIMAANTCDICQDTLIDVAILGMLKTVSTCTDLPRDLTLEQQLEYISMIHERMKMWAVEGHKIQHEVRVQ